MPSFPGELLRNSRENMMEDVTGFETVTFSMMDENSYLCTKYLCIHTEKYAGKLGAKMKCGRMAMSHTQETPYWQHSRMVYIMPLC